MKKRRTFVVTLLLIAALALGIGYAAVNGNLIVDGKVVASAQPFDVHFIDFEAGQGVGIRNNVPIIACDTELSSTTPAKTVMLNIRDMASDGDTVSAKLTIVNNNDCSMDLSVETILYGATAGAVTSSTPDYFTVSTDWENNTKTVAADGTEQITITVTMDKSCTADYTGFFRVSLIGVSTPTP